MRTLITIIIIAFIGMGNAFAVSKKSKMQQDSQHKIEQLQQLMARAKEGSGGQVPADRGAGGTQLFGTDLPSTTGIPLSGNPKSVADNTQTGIKSDGTTPPAPSLYDKAFSEMTTNLLPMSSDQVRKLRDVFNESQKAASTQPGVPPKPTSTSLMVDLSPKAAPPVIRLSAKYITSLVFIDTTGQPWPIAAYSIGDPTSFNIQWSKKGDNDNNSNILLIQSLTFYNSSNLAIILRGLNTPVMITLISGQEATDYRVDLRIPGLGPNAVFMESGLPESANPILLDVLNGIAPQGSKELKVGGDGRTKAWLLKNKLYLRTNLTLISPGWQSTMSSIDGTRAYQMQSAPVILAQQSGRDKLLTLVLEGLE